MNARQMKGFTLLEVMLALAIFALAGMALTKSVNSTLMGTNHIEDVSIAQWIAANKLVDATLDQTWPPKKASGRVEMANREWFFHKIVKETEDKNLRAITIEVRFDEKDKHEITSLVTYVSNPKAKS
ncbi:type II secretion system minor pseudopilin GspI [Thalassotalea aquiviva]|uniref:type II secretion system minor pseudopilin GspI n=1 Tax=Thalassotalea aquiviva TaxID=3242415 RepID=UPI00352AE74B